MTIEKATILTRIVVFFNIECYNIAIILQSIFWRENMGFCDDIKEIRQNCFLSQEAFAKEIGVSFATVNRWESGKTKPTYKAMKLIDDFCKKNNINFDIRRELESRQTEISTDKQ